MAILDLWVWKGNLRGRHLAFIEIGRIGGTQSAVSADTRNLVRCEAGRVLDFDLTHFGRQAIKVTVQFRLAPN